MLFWQILYVKDKEGSKMAKDYLYSGMNFLRKKVLFFYSYVFSFTGIEMHLNVLRKL